MQIPQTHGISLSLARFISFEDEKLLSEPHFVIRRNVSVPYSGNEGYICNRDFFIWKIRDTQNIVLYHTVYVISVSAVKYVYKCFSDSNTLVLLNQPYTRKVLGYSQS
jgi:hypothetical protein